MYFGESERSLKSRSDERKRFDRNCDCGKNEIAKHCWEAGRNFSWDQKNVIERESRLISRKIKGTTHSLKNPNHGNKIFYMLPEIWLSNLLMYVTVVDFNQWNLRKLITAASVKLYCLITLICLIILISHIAQLLLIRKFYCFRPGSHVLFVYSRYNHLRWPMMREVSLET